MSCRLATKVCSAVLVVAAVVNGVYLGGNSSALSDDPLDSANAKIYYQAISNCIEHDLFSYSGPALPGLRWIDQERVSRDEIFLEYAEHVGYTYGSNYLPINIYNQYGNDCMHVFQRVIEENLWGVSRLEVYCDGANPGLLAPDKHEGDNSNVSCSDWFSDKYSGTPMHAITSTRDSSFDPQAYLDRILTEKTFGGFPPGGSLELTPAEESAWWNSYSINVCAGTLTDGPGENILEIKSVNAQTGLVETKYFYAKNLDDTEKCQEVADKMENLIDDAQEEIRKALEGRCGVSGGVLSGNSQDGYICTSRENPGEIIDIPYRPGDGVGLQQTSSIDLGECDAAAGVFSWLICPFLEQAIGVTQDASKVIDDFLKIDPRMFSSGEVTVDTDGDGLDDDTEPGLVYGWGIFRDLANVVLVVLFVAIILSQITGVGIDNYGIKKMLPRLIVIGILINLSFIVCQLVVDVSNIIGANAYAFLKFLASGFSFSGAGVAGGSLLTVLIMGILGILIVAILNPVTLLPMVLAVLGALISMVFMFMLLGIRQAAVAIFIVIAPLAFAANILPNTTGLFKKWWNIFKTLLILYPICGLVMGGAYFGSRMLMSIGEIGEGTVAYNIKNIVIALVSLILLFAPIFFIPKLVKGAFDGLGKIGGAIAGLGGRCRGAVTGGIQKSEVYGRAQTALKGRSGFMPGTRAIRRQAAMEAKEGRKAAIRKGKFWREHPEMIRARELVTEDAEKEAVYKAQATMYANDPKNQFKTDAEVYEDFAKAMDNGKIDEARAIMSVGNDRFGPGMAKSVAEYLDKNGSKMNDAQRSMVSEYASKNTGFMNTLKTKTPAMADWIVNNGRSNKVGYFRKADGSLQEVEKGTPVSAEFYKRATLNVNGDEIGSNSSADKYTDWVGASSGSLDDAMMGRDASGALQLGGGTFNSAMARGMLSPNASPQTKEYLNTLNATTKANLQALAMMGGGGGGAPAPTGGTPAPAPVPAGGAPTGTPAPAPMPASPVPNVSAMADRLNAGTGNVRGDVAGESGGRFIVQGPDAGREQTDSGIIIAH